MLHHHQSFRHTTRNLSFELLTHSFSTNTLSQVISHTFAFGLLLTCCVFSCTMSGMPERMSSALRKQKEQPMLPMSSNDMCIVDARTIAQASTKRDDCHHHRG